MGHSLKFAEPNRGDIEKYEKELFMAKTLPTMSSDRNVVMSKNVPKRLCLWFLFSFTFYGRDIPCCLLNPTEAVTKNVERLEVFILKLHLQYVRGIFIDLCSDACTVGMHVVEFCSTCAPCAWE
jgi:hypothetical protein